MICATCGYDMQPVGHTHYCKACTAIARAEKAVVRAAELWLDRYEVESLEEAVITLRLTRQRAQQARRVK